MPVEIRKFRVQVGAHQFGRQFRTHHARSKTQHVHAVIFHALMRGVKSLLDALSPKALDLAFEELEKQGKTNFACGPWRFKELWRLYNAKHGDVDDGDKRMFSALFGPDFAESYKQYRATIDTPESSA